ncbi:MAG TPA: prolipoprotein diacylglyceryl transferase, partial [Candidatus Pacebacteria bacterium]|nr:prolipoprotein diacylglyceryl transferase [Candidatus Paceibacterota bacterium]
KNKKDIIALFDFIVPAVPLGFMFGRIGNFFNEELVGRITTSPFGIYFNDEIVQRHPSQLYEAFFEGLLLFIILWSLRNRKLQSGMLGVLYLIGYAIARFIVEFFREPDEHLGFVLGMFTMGQVLSFIMFVIGVGIFFKIKNRHL